MPGSLQGVHCLSDPWNSLGPIGEGQVGAVVVGCGGDWICCCSPLVAMVLGDSLEMDGGCWLLLMREWWAVGGVPCCCL